jgi:hypothetical protein
MDEDNLLPFPLPAVCRKKVSVAFDGGLLSSDGGVLVLRDVERRVGLAELLAGCLTDRRDRARTSCRSPRANQFRLILHTAAYWLLHTLRAAAPKRSGWKTAEFATLRLRLIKIAARVVEGAARIRVRLPTARSDAAIFRLLAGRFAAAGP